MTHRERFYEAASHGHPDRAVYDLGCPQTWVDYDTTKKDLAKLLGIEGKDNSYPWEWYNHSVCRRPEKGKNE